MTTHIKAFTYLPKIEAVRAGSCRQTIRPLGKRPVKVGDKILFHGWAGRPYRSKWSWRMEVVVDEVWDISVDRDGITWHWDEPYGSTVDMWEAVDADRLARADGIEPPTGTALRNLMLSMYGKRLPMGFQIIRWGLQAKLDI